MINIIFGKNGFVGKSVQTKGESPTRNECDLRDYKSTFHYLNKFKNEKINIINLAAKVAGVFYNRNHNVEMLYENTLISLNLIKAIKELNLDCYLLSISSVCAYNENLIMEENQYFDGLPSENNFGYGVSKKISYLSAKALQIDNPKFKFGCLIPTNMYGENDNISEQFSHVIPALFTKMLRKNDEEVNIFGNANNIRNFLYVKDLGKTIDFFVNQQIEGYYNISSDEETTIFDLTQKIKKITGCPKVINFDYLELPNKRIIKNNKLKTLYREIGEEFKITPLEEGLQNTYEWIKNNQNEIPVTN